MWFELETRAVVVCCWSNSQVSVLINTYLYDNNTHNNILNLFTAADGIVRHLLANTFFESDKIMEHPVLKDQRVNVVYLDNCAANAKLPNLIDETCESIEGIKKSVVESLLAIFCLIVWC